jgi:hypothetical protein
MNNKLLFLFESSNYDCFHFSHRMFFRCEKHDIDKHLHCISCGIILTDDEELREIVGNSTIYNYRYPCKKLFDFDL